MRIRRIHKVAQNDRGFSLIELLIAMCVMALGMLAAASMQYSAVRNNTTGNTSTQANMLAKATLEMLKGQDIESTALAVGDYVDPSPVDADGNPGGIYNRSWRIDPLGASTRRISVTVAWTRFGSTRQVTMRTNTMGSGV
ncbi:MAG: prepilin-type N-terminal cleavage/methylation domain-containing protein [Desulfobacterales bacterium]|nr:prepilin-type N-terminal cleavage/methylation domain-containing protein [Desulfobacterales bacterium]